MGIKPGIYTFKDSLNVPSFNLSANIGFNVSVKLPDADMGVFEGAKIEVIVDGASASLRYTLVTCDLDTEGLPGFPYELEAYYDRWFLEYGEIKTIEVIHETEVSNEFLWWFVENIVTGGEEPDDPDEPVTTNIKAGTYRFNDLLTLIQGTIEQELTFGVDIILGGMQTRATCNRISVAGALEATNDTRYTMLAYSIGSLSPSISDAPDKVYVLNYKGWDVSDYGEGIQTITIAEDVTASLEFYNWFNANAVAVPDPDEPDPDEPDPDEPDPDEPDPDEPDPDEPDPDEPDPDEPDPDEPDPDEPDPDEPDPDVPVDPANAAVVIRYNGIVIATLNGGQTATLKCKGLTMASDVVVSVSKNTGGAAVLGEMILG